jgi:hypothetical protein
MEIKENLNKEKVSKNKATEIHYNMHGIKPIYCSLHPSTRRHGYGF